MEANRTGAFGDFSLVFSFARSPGNLRFNPLKMGHWGLCGGIVSAKMWKVGRTGCVESGPFAGERKQNVVPKAKAYPERSNTSLPRRHVQGTLSHVIPPSPVLGGCRRPKSQSRQPNCVRPAAGSQATRAFLPTPPMLPPVPDRPAHNHKSRPEPCLFTQVSDFSVSGTALAAGLDIARFSRKNRGLRPSAHICDTGQQSTSPRRNRRRLRSRP